MDILKNHDSFKYFDRKKKLELKDTDLVFQAVSWNDKDISLTEDDDDDVSGFEKKEYVIYINGVTKEGNTVAIQVKGFTPYFYVEIPDQWDSNTCEIFFKFIKKKLGKLQYGLCRYKVVKKYKLFPYLAKKTFKFIQLYFTSDCTYKRCKYMFNEPLTVYSINSSPTEYIAYETVINHINRFCHVKGLQTTGWITIEKKYLTDTMDNCQLSYSVDWKRVNLLDLNETAPLTIMSYDLECLPEDKEDFPNPTKPNDIISQMSMVFNKYGMDKKLKIILSVRKSDPIQDAVVISGLSEKELLEKYCEIIQICDPDIVTGYNIWGFDDNYIWKRIELHGVDTTYLTRLPDIPCEFKKQELKSNAYGDNEYLYIFYPGRQTIDLMQVIRKDYKLSSYKLDDVAEKFLGEKKHEMPIRVLFEYLSSNDSSKIKITGEYCIQDSDLVGKLMYKLNYIPNLFEMAKTTCVPLNWLLFRGQQCKVYSLITQKARSKNHVVHVIKSKGGESKFKGATVIDPKAGMHFVPVAGLDFASLYPSIIIAYNLCYSTYIANAEMFEYVKTNNIPYFTIEWVEKDLEGNISAKHSYSFVQCADDKGNVLENGIKGILPEILEELWKGRKATKKQMKTEEDPFKKALLDGKQLSQKLTMNSSYGFTGAENAGILPFKIIAACVTAMGRKVIDLTSAKAKEKYGAETLYGDTDSCYVTFNINKKGYATEVDYMKKNFEIAQECADYITSSFKPPMELEFEKFMYPFCLYKKKRYAYTKWTEYTHPDGIEYKGLQLVRRDTCEWAKIFFDEIFKKIMIQRSIKDAYEVVLNFIKETVKEFLNGDVNQDQLVLTKQLKKNYKVRKNNMSIEKHWTDPSIQQPHVRLAQELRKINPSDCYKPPDRVPYIFIENKKTLQCDKVIDPKKFILGTHKIDSIYYFDHQIRKPLNMILKPMIDNPETLYINLYNSKLNKLRNQSEITSFFKIKKSSTNDESLSSMLVEAEDSDSTYDSDSDTYSVN